MHRMPGANVIVSCLRMTWPIMKAPNIRVEEVTLSANTSTKGVINEKEWTYDAFLVILALDGHHIVRHQSDDQVDHCDNSDTLTYLDLARNGGSFAYPAPRRDSASTVDTRTSQTRRA